MKNFFKTLCLISLLLITTTISNAKVKSFSIQLKNPTNDTLNNVVVVINESSLLKAHPYFRDNTFIIKDGDKQLANQFVKNYDAKGNAVLVEVSLLPKEIKKLTFTNSNEKREVFKKKTQAYLGEKIDYVKNDSGFYTGGKYVSVNETRVPKDHFAHDALYQYEGPGWESDKIACRFYIDKRNKVDLWGKKISDVVLDKVGLNDLISNSNESYSRMMDWGMDMFKVASSLGDGSIATLYKGKVEAVSNTDSIFCQIVNNGDLYSRIKTIYYGWNFGDKNKYDLTSEITIKAGSRLFSTSVMTDKNIENITTGLAKHENTEFFSDKGNKNGWGYIALWGLQSLSGDQDHLGIAIFFKNKDLLNITEDESSKLVVLKPKKGEVQYYGSEAWELEPNGIKTRDEYVQFLNSVIEELNNPVIINYK